MIKNIRIFGDIVIDNFFEISDYLPLRNPRIDWHLLSKVVQQEGGAKFTKKIITEVLDGKISDIKISELPEYSEFYPRTFSIISNDSHNKWRVKEYLNMDFSRSKDGLNGRKFSKCVIDNESLVVFIDHDLFIKNTLSIWPRLSKNNWLIYKCSKGLISEKLWNLVIKDHSEKTIAIIKADDLRKSEVRITRGFSWEQTISEILLSLDQNPDIKYLRCVHFLIINFNNHGALIIDNQNKHNIFIVNPSEFEIQQEFIELQGLNSLIIAALCFSLTKRGNSLNLDEMAQSVLLALISFNIGFEAGYSKIQENKKSINWIFPDISSSFLNYALKTFFQEITVRNKDLDDLLPRINAFAKYRFEDPNPFHKWTLLELNINYGSICNRIVYHGIQKVKNEIPIIQFGNFISIDRNEIEDYKNISLTIEEYKLNQDQIKPLCLAVFGKPGSGKSFGVQQIAKSQNLSKEIFNLSQMTSIDDFYKSLHAIRDDVLSNEPTKKGIPIIFWDEFDSEIDANKELIWIKRFLEPMQDGTFTENQRTHPLGRCIFIFASSRYDSLNNFISNNSEPTKNDKKVDFLSRVRGYINVEDINLTYETIDRWGVSSFEKKSDYYKTQIRRAILLRSFLIKRLGKPEIDRGVKNAFLNIPIYKHGIRSMEAIIEMSQLTGMQKFFKSSLPSIDQLELHVDGQEFIRLANSISLAEVEIDRIIRNLMRNIPKLLKILSLGGKYEACIKKHFDEVNSDNSIVDHYQRLIEDIDQRYLFKNQTDEKRIPNYGKKYKISEGKTVDKNIFSEIVTSFRYSEYDFWLSYINLFYFNNEFDLKIENVHKFNCKILEEGFNGANLQLISSSS
jgi:hypothetical protein